MLDDSWIFASTSTAHPYFNKKFSVEECHLLFLCEGPEDELS